MDLTASLANGSAQPVVLVLMALLLGALHGLEPGHSKTMMAAFIIAVRGTVGQAVLLGVSAALSHTVIVWVLGLAALWVGEEAIGEEIEPYFMMASGAIILIIAGWMTMRILRGRGGLSLGGAGHDHVHDDAHPHPHDHVHPHGHPHSHDHSPDHDHAHGHGGDHHPHRSHDHHVHDHDHPVHEAGAAGHVSSPAHAGAAQVACAAGPSAASVQGAPRTGGSAGLDAHAAAHARDLELRFASGRATRTQTILFGLSGGLIPCSAAITVLIVCLHLKQVWLGVTLVGAFSIGLALTLVAIGVVAALGLRYVSRKTDSLDTLLSRAPLISAALIAVIGVMMVITGWQHSGL